MAKAKGDKAPQGRPTKHTPALAAEICTRLADGESLRSVCRDEAMPAEATVRRWAMDDHAGFSAQYARAREVGYLGMADELLSISDDGENDTYLDGEGNKRTDHDVVARSRLRVDTRKWLLAKMLPKVFGDKIAVEHQNPLRSLSDERLDAALAAVEAALRQDKPGANGTTEPKRPTLQ